MPDYEVEVLVRGRPVTVFKHKGDHFVEGRHGSSFELRVTNNTWSRIEVVGSVDGLSVTDGEECGPESDGYIVPPKESIVIPGWKLPNDKAAEFVFEDRRKSYSNQVGKGTQNVGVIGLMVFTEKVVEKPDPVYIPQPYPVPTPNPYPNPWDRPWDMPWDRTIPSTPTVPYWTINSASDSGITRSINAHNTVGYSSSGTIKSFEDNINETDICDSLELNNDRDGALIDSSIMPCNMVTESLAVQADEDDTDEASLFAIGSGWGDEVDHKVTQVEYERTDRFNPDKILSIFYDTKNGLENRGIQVIKTKKKRVSDLPNAFPTYKSSGCNPPRGWKGKK